MISSVYVSEISSPEHRGLALSLLALSYMLGSLISSALQCLISWRYTAVYFSLASIVMMTVIQFIPESPYWLVMKGLHSEATNVLEKIRGCYGGDVSKKDGIQQEISDICEHVRKKTSEVNDKISFAKKVRLKVISLSSIWKQMLILIVFATLHRLSGFLPLTQYTVLFFDQLNTPVDGNHASLVHSFVCFVTTFTVPYFVHFYDRRFLLCITSLLAGCGMLMTWLYELGMYQYPDQTQAYFWIALLGVYAYDVATTVGITSILVMLPAELLPTEISGSATTSYSIIVSLITTVISKTYFKVLGYIGLLWFLFSFIASSFLLALLSAVLLPETRGKTLREIQQAYFKNGSNKGARNEINAV